MSEAVREEAGQRIARDITFQATHALAGGRPLFLIVYYEHEGRKLAFLKSLAEALHQAGIGCQTFDPVHRPEHGAGSLYPKLAATVASRTLALITALPRSTAPSDPATTFLDYLNLHRDRIERDKLRLVLFLHTSEAERFMAEAGDLWDFRHHTYWLEGMPPADWEALLPALDGAVTKTALTAEDKETIAAHLREVRALIDQTPDPEEKAALFLDLSQWLTRRYAPALGAEVALTGIELLPAGPSALRARLEHELGYALRRDHNLSDALTHYDRALAIRRETGDRSGEGATLNNIAQIYHDWGRYDEALHGLEQSLVIRREIGDRAGEGPTLNNIAAVYHAWGRNDEALPVLEESLVICREIGDRVGEGITLNNIAQIYQAWGRYDEALPVLEHSLTICREIGDRAGEGTTLNNIAQIYWTWGRYDEALRGLEQSLALWREIGDRAGEGATLNNIAQIYQAWGRNDEALQAMEQSLSIRREIGDRAGEGGTSWNLAVEYQRRGDLVKACEFARATVAIREELHHPEARQSREFLQRLEQELAENQVQPVP